MADNRRSRSWAFVVYPDDSLPSNYLDLIQSWHIPALISPVHDKDMNADETEKKKHIHILFVFDGLKSYSQMCDYSDQLCGTKPILVENTNGMIRYFIHLDNPEKAQYNIKDLITLSGFDYSNAFDSIANDCKMFEQFESVVKCQNISNFYSLIEYCKKEDLHDLINWLRSHSNNYIKMYLYGKQQIKHNKWMHVNNETGEVKFEELKEN